jgi:hypothetical protein
MGLVDALPGRSVYLDTNIFVYWLGTTSDEIMNDLSISRSQSIF